MYKLIFVLYFQLTKSQDTIFKPAVCYPPTSTDLELAGFKITDSNIFKDHKYRIILDSHFPDLPEYHLNQEVIFKCSTGHLSGEVKAKCQPPITGLIEGGWLFSGNCVPKLCHMPTLIDNAYFVDGETGGKLTRQQGRNLIQIMS